LRKNSSKLKMGPTKIRVDKTEYIPSKHIMMWEVTFVDQSDDRHGKSIILTYRANDLASAFLGRDDVQVTEEGARAFNENVQGRIINLVEILDQPSNQDIRTADANKYLDYNVQLREYPFEEVYDMLNGE